MGMFELAWAEDEAESLDGATGVADSMVARCCLPANELALGWKENRAGVLVVLVLGQRQVSLLSGGE
jgi:hypothetical protein